MCRIAFLVKKRVDSEYSGSCADKHWPFRAVNTVSMHIWLPEMQLQGINDYPICWDVSVSSLDCSFSISHVLSRGLCTIFSAIRLVSSGWRHTERDVYY